MMIRKQNEEIQNKVQMFESQISTRIRYFHDSVKRLTSVPPRVSRVSMSSAVNDDSVATNNCSILGDSDESERDGEGRPDEL